MKKNIKWAIALAPFVLAGCSDNIDLGQNTHYATQGDDVQFAVSKAQSKDKTRTMYDDDWEHVLNQNGQGLIWGNYNSSKGDTISIYCPTNTTRGFAKYAISPRTEGDKSYAQAVVKTSEIGVQWASKGEHTFYAFYPADKASESLKDGVSVITATVDNNQSPVMYKKANSDGSLSQITSFKTYIKEEFDGSSALPTPRSIYGMPKMEAAVMAANTLMSEAEFGHDVPLQFNMLADVLDITFHGPVTPNTLGGNANPETHTEGVPKPSIQIQSVTIDVVKREGDKVEDYPIDNDTPITGRFDLDLSYTPQRTIDVANPEIPTAVDPEMVKNVVGTSTIHMNTALPESDGSGTYYPTLFVRGESTNAANLDHLRLRAFLIPGQISKAKGNLKNLRIHIQTDCGEFYQMLNEDDKFATGRLYPVKLGYFQTRGADFDLSKWIGQLDPNIYLSELSIPGAWHASNTNYQGDVSYKDLYNAGIRAFEVHTRSSNSTIVPKTVGDFNTDFVYDPNKEYTEEECFAPYPNGDPKITVDNSTVVRDMNNAVYGDGTLSRTRSVSAPATIVATKALQTYIIPRFWIRLYRTHRNTGESEDISMSDKIIELSKVMNSNALMFLEFGQNGSSNTVNAYWHKHISEYYTATVNTTVTGTQRRDYVGASWDDAPITWNAVSDDVAKDVTTWVPAGQTTEINTNRGTINLDNGKTWSIAVRSCIERLMQKYNKELTQDVVYTGTVDRNTTIADVAGHIIVKVNTNDDTGNETEAFWEGTPALFSRWVDGSANAPMTINLKWGSIVSPYVGDVTGQLHDGLRWCFTEIDNIDKSSSITKRQNAIVEMNKIAYENYKNGLHRTFYEPMIGGYKNQDEKTAGETAKTLNTFVYNRLSDPTRQNVPHGLVFMNFAIAPKNENGTEQEGYNSAALIRAIINNNKAFMLHRKGDVEQQTGE